MPRFLVPALVANRSRIARRRPAVLADARAQMRFVVGDDQPDEVMERIAGAHVRRSIWRGESRWHPELVNQQKILGVEQLRKLREAGAGFIVNFVHHGDYEGISPSLARAGIPNHSVTTSEHGDPAAPIWMKQQARVIGSHEGVTVLDVAAGSAGIKEVLATGAAVAIAMDQPGHTPMSFLGHDLLLTSGFARVAKDNNVPVAVLTSHPDPTDPTVCGMFRVVEVLQPDAFDSVEALLDVLLRHHEAGYRSWPEAAEHPLRVLNRELVKPPSKYHPRGWSHTKPQHDERTA